MRRSSAILVVVLLLSIPWIGSTTTGTTNQGIVVGLRGKSKHATGGISGSRGARSTACGVERFDVKTLSDPAAARVDPIPENTTIAILAKPDAVDRCHGGNDPRGYGPQEFKTYAVEGTITVAKLEADHDVHIAIAEVPPADTSNVDYATWLSPGFGHQMIVEVVDPACATHSAIYAELVAARAQLRGLIGPVPLTRQALAGLVGKRVRVVGVGFFDKSHGQSGMAESCQELHPVRSIEKIVP